MDQPIQNPERTVFKLSFMVRLADGLKFQVPWLLVFYTVLEVA